ncbi:peptidoglycan DD-metalloendopeptidase family protein [Patescibacteria group bacterium]
MEDLFQDYLDFVEEVKEFFLLLTDFILKKLHISFIKFEKGKGAFVTALYKQRGKLARRFMHTGMAGLVALGMVIAPVVAQEFPGRSVNPWEVNSPSAVLSASTEDMEVDTLISDKMRDRIIEYTIQEGDTVSTIAEKFGVSTDSIRWQNDLASKDSIKVGQILEILPITGVAHKVKKGDTVYSISKYYDTSAQGIVDFPFNAFVNDETFELAIGQTVIVPDGIKPSQVLWQPLARVKQTTPNAGSVTASGVFVWPTNGNISQRFVWYHKGIDIANKVAPSVLAADSGTVIIAGWPDGYGYGNRVMIDHGNGYKTLYAHLSRVSVVIGQTVARGNVIGQMGSTGRSTGVHLHFEVIKNGVYLDPLSVLR